jgi:hypothetical protein
LLGVVGSDSRVGFVRPLLKIDQEFVEAARRARAPEKRFRFAQPCVEHDCRHWQGGRCGVADAAVKLDAAEARPLPGCSIRPSCRWFSQGGASACAACPYVVTDITGALVHRADAVAPIQSSHGR